MLPAMIDFADLHSHLVPGVDDGSASVEESLDSLQTLRAEGVEALVTTPHLLLPRLGTDAAIDRELERHRRAFEGLLDAVGGEDGLPAIGLGQEIWAPDAAAIARVLHRADVGLGGSEYLLVEFGFRLTGTHLDVVDAVAASGRRIVVAHPERYEFAPDADPVATVARWREHGALLQINAGSLNGYYVDQNPGSERLAWQFVEQGLADLISTDHHGVRRAGVSPAEAWDTLVERGFAAEAAQLLSAVPGRIVRAGVAARQTAAH